MSASMRTAAMALIDAAVTHTPRKRAPAGKDELVGRIIGDAEFDALCSYMKSDATGATHLVRSTLSRYNLGPTRMNQVLSAMRKRALEIPDVKVGDNIVQLDVPQWSPDGAAKKIGDSLFGSGLQRMLYDSDITTVVGNLETPDGYVVDEDGVRRGDVEVADEPILIVGRSVDEDSGATSLVMVWRSGKQWQREVVPRETVMTASRIVSLSARGAPINSGNARKVILYLSKFERRNKAALPHIRTSTYLGWATDLGEGATEFILPEGAWISDTEIDHVVIQPKQGTRVLLDIYRQRGSLREWKKAAMVASQYPHVMLAIYASAAAAMLHPLGAPNFVFDISGETSGGKTTAHKMGVTVWGYADDRDGTLPSWDQTIKWIEDYGGLCRGVPMYLDDHKLCRNPDDIAHVVYMWCSGQARGRGNVDGVNATEQFRGVLTTTGEKPAVSATTDGGLKPRVITLTGYPLGFDGGKAREDIDFMMEVIKRHHGHLGRLLVRYLLTHKESWSRLRSAYKTRKRRLAELALVRSPVAARTTDHIAVLDITKRVLEALGLPKPLNGDPIAIAVKSVLGISEEVDPAARAFRLMVGWCATNRSRFFSKTAGTSPPHGSWLGRWEDRKDWLWIGIRLDIVDRTLKGWGFDPGEILPIWKQRGLTISASGRAVGRTSIGGVPLSVVKLRRRAVDNCYAALDEEDNSIDIG